MYAKYGVSWDTEPKIILMTPMAALFFVRGARNLLMRGRKAFCRGVNGILPPAAI